MMKKIRLMLLLFGTGFLSCDSMENEPVTNENLGRTKWRLEGYKETANSGFEPANFRYILEFINDSTYTMNLDVNRVYGHFEYVETGIIRIKDTGSTEVCCDSKYTNELMHIFSQAENYRSGPQGLLLVGTGELYFVKEE